MREILFKAKRLDNGEWVEGYYVYCRKRHYILPVLNKAIGFDEREDEWIEIDPDTICQYTGLTDKNGKKIWENDIVSDGERLWQVHYYKHFAMYMLKGINHNGGSNGMNTNLTECKVVGNIFDNPELLEVE